MVVSRSRIVALDCSDLILGGAGLERLKSLRTVGISLYSKLETHLRNVVSKAAMQESGDRTPNNKAKLSTSARELLQCMFCLAGSIVPPRGCRWRSLN